MQNNNTYYLKVYTKMFINYIYNKVKTVQKSRNAIIFIYISIAEFTYACVMQTIAFVPKVQPRLKPNSFRTRQTNSLHLRWFGIRIEKVSRVTYP